MINRLSTYSPGLISASVLSIVLTFLTSLAWAEGGEDDLVQYIDLKPSFVLNFGGVGPDLKYVKADVSVRVKKRTAAAAVEHHLPYLRNELVLFLSQQTDESMGNNEGREKLRLDALKLLQGFLEKEEGAPMIDDLLFTNFVVQR